MSATPPTPARPAAAPGDLPPAGAPEPARQVTAHPSAAEPTALGRGLLVLGDRWTLLVLRRMFIDHDRRFSQLRDALGVADSVLASRLDDMEASGLLERRMIDGRPEYWLAAPGLALWRTLVAMTAWEREWAAGEPARTIPALTHLGCEQRTNPHLGCPHCGEVIRPRDLETTLAPEARLDLAAAPRQRRRSSKQEPLDEGVFTYETLMLMGDRWSVVLFCAILLGARGFTEIQRMVGISPTVLADRLRRLEQAGVVQRTPVGANRVEYPPTAKGVAFFGVLALMVDWARRWMQPPAAGDAPAEPDALVQFRHRSCGQVITPVLLCDGCGGELQRREVRWDSAR